MQVTLKHTNQTKPKADKHSRLCSYRPVAGDHVLLHLLTLGITLHTDRTIGKFSEFPEERFCRQVRRKLTPAQNWAHLAGSSPDGIALRGTATEHRSPPQAQPTFFTNIKLWVGALHSLRNTDFINRTKLLTSWFSSTGLSLVAQIQEATCHMWALMKELTLLQLGLYEHMFQSLFSKRLMMFSAIILDWGLDL